MKNISKHRNRSCPECPQCHPKGNFYPNHTTCLLLMEETVAQNEAQPVPYQGVTPAFSDPSPPFSGSKAALQSTAWKGTLADIKML